MKNLLFLFLSFMFLYLPAQDRKIDFPDVEGFQTLKVDLHIHTVFSDGRVWPSIRVDEAVRDGLDAIALTEHIEYQPWQADIPHPDRNRSYILAKEAAKPHDLIVIHGTEITRSMPPGHANALFIQDVNKLILEDPREAYEAARKQGAFIFWNHPNWINQQKDALPFISDFHRDLIDNDLLHGMEIVNDLTFSEDGLKIALEENLTMIGTSDIHGLVDYQFEIADGGHRPITLVLAIEKSESAIKEALFAGRTITWFDNILAGKNENMQLLMDACLEFKNLGYIGDSEVLEYQITNKSDAKFLLNNVSEFTFYRNTDIITVEPQSTKVIQIIMSKKKLNPAVLKFKVLNAIVGYKQPFVLEKKL